MKLLCFSLSSIIVKEIYSSLGALVRQNNVSDGMLFPENLYFIFFICLFVFCFPFCENDQQNINKGLFSLIAVTGGSLGYRLFEKTFL